jgi:hypothetical protein
VTVSRLYVDYFIPELPNDAKRLIAALQADPYNNFESGRYANFRSETAYSMILFPVSLIIASQTLDMWFKASVKHSPICATDVENAGSIGRLQIGVHEF